MTTKTTREQAKKTVMRSPRHFGKNALITAKFLASCEAGESVEFRHPKYICMSLKRLQHLLEKSCKQQVKNTDTLGMSRAEWIDELKSVFAKAKKEQRAIFPNVVMFIEDLLEKEIEEVVKISDDIEIENETTFEEWKAFNRFRNTLRDRYLPKPKEGK